MMLPGSGYCNVLGFEARRQRAPHRRSRLTPAGGNVGERALRRPRVRAVLARGLRYLVLLVTVVITPS